VQWINQIWFRIGVATGEIVYNRGGGPDKLAGATIGRAARLESGGRAGQTLVDPDTFAALPISEQNEYEPTPEVFVNKHGVRIQARRHFTVILPETTVTADTSNASPNGVKPAASQACANVVTTDTRNASPNGRSKGAAKQLGESSTRPKVFISYSHHDKRFLLELMVHLKPYDRSATFTAWSDEHVATGSPWPIEIKDALNEAKLAVLLVSPSFLASEYIHKHEFRPLLEKAKKNQVQMLWVPIQASSFQENPLEQIRAAYNPKRPLAQMGGAARSSAWVKVCVEIEKALSRE